MSIQFAKLGSTLVLWDINETGNLETAEMIKRDGGNAACFTVDCSKREAIYAAADKVGGTETMIGTSDCVLKEPVHSRG